MKILVTGGTGFIGSHTCVELLDAGYEVVIIDNLYNSKREVAQRIEQISGHHVSFYEEDCLDEQALERIFTEHKIDAVIHFAGYKAVGESVAKPLMYYENTEPVQGDAQTWLPASGILFQRHGIWRSAAGADR